MTDLPWFELEEFTTGNTLYAKFTKATPLVVFQSKQEEMCYVKINDQLVTVKGKALDIIMEIDQHLTKEDRNV